MLKTADNITNAGFTSADFSIAFKNTKGGEEIMPAYTISDETRAWDAIPDQVTHALFSARLGCMLYVEIKITGRCASPVFGRVSMPRGIRARLRFSNCGPESGYDMNDETIEAWQIRGLSS